MTDLFKRRQRVGDMDNGVVLGTHLEKSESKSLGSLMRLCRILRDIDKVEFTIEDVRIQYKSEKITFNRERVAAQLGDLVSLGDLQKEGTAPNTVFYFPGADTAE